MHNVVHSVKKHQNMIPYRVVIVDCTHVGSAIVSFEDLVSMHKENSIADILVEIKLRPHFDMVTVPGRRTPQT